MNITFSRLAGLLGCIAAVGIAASVAHADPLVGRDLLKFSQKPMNTTTVIDHFGTVGTYFGHDELSTAYGFVNPQTNAIPQYEGRYMADDFADKLSSPIVHVKWWGSYSHDFINLPVNKFLISFESDVPAPQPPVQGFSHPGQPLLNQVVQKTNGSLAPGGLYTEKLIRGPDPILGESLYEYNAELHLNLPFPEVKDTVYWLKIAAMVDVPSTLAIFDPYNPQASPIQVTQWGWHNRDYTIQDTLASTGLPSPPGGEVIEGVIGLNQPVYHFQDDSIQGTVRILPGASGGYLSPNIFQPPATMVPQRYVDGIDGPGPGPIPGTTGISAFSKDLAFELYTIVPEPATCSLVACSLLGMAMSGGRRRKRRLALG